jgi:SAM-dependent methyltransferase
MARVLAGRQALDVATGPGYVAAAAGSRGAHVIGIDFSERMIERAWWKYPGIEFRKAEAENLPFGDGIFDCVLINFGMLHFGNPDKALSEARRVLVRGGRLAFTSWRTDDSSAGFGLIYDAIDRFGGAVEMPEGEPYARFAHAPEIERTLKLIGFTQVSVQDLSLTWSVEGADEVLSALEAGAVRTAAILKGQSPDSTAQIRKHLADGLASYRTPSGYDLIMPAIVAGATKR